MCLVIILCFFVGEGEVERDLVRLVHDGAMAGDIDRLGTGARRDVAQIFFRAAASASAAPG